ncbi:hypothetical protein [Enterococcus columbae]|uniref:DUF5648 domain-containing protein n=1 Tax=Enterococcus columbae DSM 7374 = ATCC 51263 TaxID=1121865 RepID=S1NS58_9ENTE|nr:hypothetical protein [Enterococcus columbae]EOT38062.1 hypothetical protein OMW_02320 [Enterococcus columbae DSM 7374 = ATCC 51263]EOW83729.1 hypothetical protein I568_01531 [Enterococcus columbae DSM 7374 = ATCC 51263]OJG24855.1 hypothetical protein RR47_GL002211 [Enterococcus columbae DSM 7374 = ATCC 51263]
MKNLTKKLCIFIFTIFIPFIFSTNVHAQSTDRPTITIQYYGEGNIQVREHKQFSFDRGQYYDLTEFAYPTALSIFENIETPIESISKGVFDEDNNKQIESLHGGPNDIEKLFKGVIYTNQIINVYYVVPSTNPSYTLPDNTEDTPNSSVMRTFLFRLYNKYTGEHFYTLDSSEKDHLISVGWNDENIGWYPPIEGNSVYRLYNPYSGEHFYTISKDEYSHLGKIGWKQEGVAFYSLNKEHQDAQPIYRLYNPYAKNVGSHHFTTSSSERDYLITQGWKDEGIAFYGCN